MSVRVRVDLEACTGHGRCYALGPEVFGADEFGHCEILVPEGEVPPELEAQARAGRDNCPERAITLEE